MTKVFPPKQRILAARRLALSLRKADTFYKQLEQTSLKFDERWDYELHDPILDVLGIPSNRSVGPPEPHLPNYDSSSHFVRDVYYDLLLCFIQGTSMKIDDKWFSSEECFDYLVKDASALHTIGWDDPLNV